MTTPLGRLGRVKAAFSSGMLQRSPRFRERKSSRLCSRFHSGRTTFVSYSALDAIPWFQAVALANPVTYVSEAVRAATTNGPHLGTGYILLGLPASIAIFGAWGLHGFQRRAVG